MNKFNRSVENVLHTVIGKISEKDLANFSDAELNRVFGDCVMANRLISTVKEMVKAGIFGDIAAPYNLPSPDHISRMAGDGYKLLVLSKRHGSWGWLFHKSNDVVGAESISVRI